MCADCAISCADDRKTCRAGFCVQLAAVDLKLLTIYYRRIIKGSARTTATHAHRTIHICVKTANQQLTTTTYRVPLYNIIIRVCARASWKVMQVCQLTHTEIAGSVLYNTLEMTQMTQMTMTAERQRKRRSPFMRHAFQNLVLSQTCAEIYYTLLLFVLSESVQF